MVKKLLTSIMLIFVLAGLGIGVYFAVFSNTESKDQLEKDENIFGKIQTKQVEVTEFFTFGKCLNVSGKLTGISKDNFESAKLYLTDGLGFEKTYPLEGRFEEEQLIVFSTSEINTGLILDDLPEGKLVLLIRLKLNNSVNPKYYSLTNVSEYSNIEYDTVTKEETNHRIQIAFNQKKYKNQDYSYLELNVKKLESTADVYDIVVDAGHGGKDIGEKSGTSTEADITLAYAKLLKERLETQGLKVKLTRDDANTDSYTATNMYDENGRISIACKSKAKYMLSLHINNGNRGLKGLEIYAPCKSNLDFAQNMANKIVNYTDLEYSNNHSFKKAEGVYVRNFTKTVINEYTNTANKKGYEPYMLTLDTPYLYTIREVRRNCNKCLCRWKKYELFCESVLSFQSRN